MCLAFAGFSFQIGFFFITVFPCLVYFLLHAGFPHFQKPTESLPLIFKSNEAPMPHNSLRARLTSPDYQLKRNPEYHEFIQINRSKIPFFLHNDLGRHKNC